MKKIQILLSLIVLFTLNSQAQLRVYNNGNIGIQNDSSSIKSPLVVGNSTIGSNGVAIMACDTFKGAEFIGIGTGNEYSSWTYGVRGIAKPNKNMHVGMEGRASLDTPNSSYRAIGVRGIAGNATPGYNWGVYGLLTGKNGGAAIYGTSDNSDWGQAISEGRYAGFFRGNVHVEGTLTATTITNPSDIAYKTNITSFSNNNAITKLMLMNPVAYNLKQPELPQTLSSNENDTTSSAILPSVEDKQEYQKLHYGLIAQELQQVCPELVYENPNGLLSINYLEIIPILIEAIKEQQIEIEELKNKIHKKNNNTK